MIAVVGLSDHERYDRVLRVQVLGYMFFQSNRQRAVQILVRLLCQCKTFTGGYCRCTAAVVLPDVALDFLQSIRFSGLSSGLESEEAEQICGQLVGTTLWTAALNCEHTRF